MVEAAYITQAYDLLLVLVYVLTTDTNKCMLITRRLAEMADKDLILCIIVLLHIWALL